MYSNEFSAIPLLKQIAEDTQDIAKLATSLHAFMEATICCVIAIVSFARKST